MFYFSLSFNLIDRIGISEVIIFHSRDKTRTRKIRSISFSVVNNVLTHTKNKGTNSSFSSIRLLH